MCRNCYENRGGKRGRKRETGRGGVADGDMLIYEPQGFSLTILSFTETERGGEKARETDRDMQNWGTLTGGMWRGRDRGGK